MHDIPCCYIHQYMITHPDPKRPIIIVATLQQITQALAYWPKHEPPKHNEHAARTPTTNH
ncbi:MAG TPA: hypothetical protein VMX14_13300 [Anaerolineae bacterium]|nr:hypothetical protein [Anaerolineae bacterium]